MKIYWGVIWTIQTYFNAKDNILYIFDINKTKISMTRVSKYYEAKIKDVQEQRPTAKNEVFIGL